MTPASFGIGYETATFFKKSQGEKNNSVTRPIKACQYDNIHTTASGPFPHPSIFIMVIAFAIYETHGQGWG